MGAHFTWFEYLFPSFINHHNVHVFSALLVSTLLILAGVAYRYHLLATENEVIPDGRVTLKNLMQVFVESILNLMESIIGHDAKKYFPLIAGLFIYIFCNNLLGAIPGFSPATNNTNTTLGCSILVFFYYNYQGIKAQGFVNYMKHFAGPVVFAAPIIFLIELISHAVRPITLAVRPAINLTGDHIVLGVFGDLVPLFIPIVFMAFGVFVSFVQAFVFTLLSTVYIGMSVAHEEH